MLSHYQQVLDELREKKENLASKYITELYLILSEEEHLSPGQCRAKIESDCSDIWSEDTIRKYLPPETKDKTKRKTGKISAEIKKRKKEKEQVITQNRNGQLTALIDNPSSRGENNNANDKNENDNSVGINPTENCPVGQKKHKSGAFQQVAEAWDDNYFTALLTDRHKEEVLEMMEDPLMLVDVSLEKSLLLLPPELAEQIYIEVNTSRTSEIIPEFELEHDGTKILSVRKVTL